MKKEVFDLLKKESLYLLYLFLVIIVAFKIAFFGDSFAVLMRSILSTSWLFVIPGYFSMLYWHEKLDFTQRVLIGTGLAAGLIGTVSYYLGIMGLNIKYHTIILPLLIIIMGFSLAVTKK